MTNLLELQPPTEYTIIFTAMECVNGQAVRLCARICKFLSSKLAMIKKIGNRKWKVNINFGLYIAFYEVINM